MPKYAHSTGLRLRLYLTGGGRADEMDASVGDVFEAAEFYFGAADPFLVGSKVVGRPTIRTNGCIHPGLLDKPQKGG